MYILGISAFYHDSAACLICDGEILSACQEERFTRKKHDDSFPHHSIKYCVESAGITASDIDSIVFYEKPLVKFERLLETYLAFAPRGFRSFCASLPLWVRDKLFQKQLLVRGLTACLGSDIDWTKKLLFSEHHLSHAASAFYASPFESAAILTLDGVGEWTTTSLSLGQGKEIDVLREIHFPHSLGLLYSAFTYYTGFKVNSGEYKVMGLAPYGEPKYADLITDNLITIAQDGSFHLDMSYFNYATGLTMTSRKFHKLFGSAPRTPEAPLTQREMDLAASVQQVTQDILLRLCRSIASETGQKNLCLSGGVALNCVANGILHRAQIFENIWIQPSSGDAGCALGAALSAYHLHHGKDRDLSLCTPDLMRGSYLGPEYSTSQIESSLTSLGANYEKLSESDLTDRVSNLLSTGNAIGWMQGRMEYGPRALGARSILADPRSSDMQKQLNLKVKYRESFRPFAPSILSEEVSSWFDYDGISPYMLFVADVVASKRLEMTSSEQNLFGIDKLNISRSSIPAVTHVDYSARLQTVHVETNPLYHLLLTKFYELTGCPLLVNTSFNVRGEPIVCTPEDAFRCFMGTDLDALALGNFLLIKGSQNSNLRESYENQYELD